MPLAFAAMRICSQRFYTNRAQVLMLLFVALQELGSATVDEVVAFLAKKSWFAEQPEDHKAYPASTPRVPRWRMLIAFAAQDAQECGRVVRDEDGRWTLKRFGQEELESLRAKFRIGAGEVFRGYLWTTKFKQLLDPGHMATTADRPRPATIYNEIQCRRMSRAYAHIAV
ncbi:MAG TPA: hypothetical protein VIM61_07155 [Chthoniobacterales bacterium]|jgi:hypothetical protein